jgi:acyl-CoA thioesterase-2
VLDLWSDLLECLKLDIVGSQTRFSAPNHHLEYHRIFGGQLLAQFVTTACLVTPDKTVKSLHALFPREGRADEPVHYDVTRHHDGRSFSTLSITATQTKGPIGVAAVSMHASEDGPSRQSVEPVGAVPGPDHDGALGLIPWETRSTDDLNAATTGPPEFELWMRTSGAGTACATGAGLCTTAPTTMPTTTNTANGVSRFILVAHSLVSDGNRVFADVSTSRARCSLRAGHPWSMFTKGLRSPRSSRGRRTRRRASSPPIRAFCGGNLVGAVRCGRVDWFAKSSARGF